MEHIISKKENGKDKAVYLTENGTIEVSVFFGDTSIKDIIKECLTKIKYKNNNM